MKPPDDPPRRTLRGEALETEAIIMLRNWPPQRPLTWESLAARLGVSRQALATKGRVVEAKQIAERRLEEQTTSVLDRNPVIRAYEYEIANLKQEVSLLEANNKVLMEKFSRLEHNALRLGLDTKELFKEIPPQRR